MAYLYWSLFLTVQRTLKISVFWHLKTHYLILLRPRTRCLVITHLWSYFHLLLPPQFGLGFRPVKLKSITFHFPFVPPFGSTESVKLSFWVRRLRQMSIDVCLFDMFERSTGVTKHGSSSVIISEMMWLGSGHPIWYILTIFAVWCWIYLELIKYFFLSTVTSELYRVVLLPRLTLNPLFCLALEPTVILELNILIYYLLIFNFIPKLSFIIEKVPRNHRFYNNLRMFELLFLCPS